MFHYFNGQIVDFSGNKILKNSNFGLKIFYSGAKIEGDFFLYPIIDQNHNTMYYLAFDNSDQLDLFHILIKISGIGPKIANFIVTGFVIDDIKTAIENNDVNFFKQIQGIGPKTAKKIIIELKDKIELSDLDQVEELEKIKKDIIKAVVGLGYSKTKVESFLKNYKGDITDKQNVIKEILKSL